MKVKIIAHFADEEGNYSHADLNRKPVIVDVREQIGRNWIEKGWAVARPDLEEKPPERAVIETPEDDSGIAERETATLKRKKK